MEDIFHVHTFRCGHADMVLDEAYIVRAIEVGAKSITFTDHAPFPGNPFRGRMKIEELDEYVSTLEKLKKKHQDMINVRIGLEIEYLPSFANYYKELRESGKFDILMLGQHHYEVEPGIYNFQFSKDELPQKEYQGIMAAQIAGIQSKYFDVIAHPDRAFKREHIWNAEKERLSKELITSAINNKVVLEKNLQSQRRKHNYWNEFWELVPLDAAVITGCDAHSVDDFDFFSEIKGEEKH